MSAIAVSRETIPARTVITITGTIPAYDQEGRLWEQLTPEIGRQGLTATGPGGAFEHDPEYRESGPTISVWLPVPAGTKVAPPLAVHDLPRAGGRHGPRRGALHPHR